MAEALISRVAVRGNKVGRTSKALFWGLGFALLGGSLWARPLAGSVLNSGRFRADSDLVLVRVSVVDRQEHFVPSLRRSDFRVFDNGVEQKIVDFSIEDAPLSTEVVFDASGSMQKRFALAHQALNELLADANPREEFALFLVRDQAEMVHDFTPAGEDLFGPLGLVPAKGATPLLDAVYLALDHARKAHNSRRALLIISDGDDNHSRYTEKDVLRLLREADVTVYTIGVGLRAAGPDGEQPGLDLLSELAEESGGRFFAAENDKDLAEIMKKLDIRHQYVLGYHPAGVRFDGKYHKIGIRFSTGARALRIRGFWRAGYYASDVAP